MDKFFRRVTEHIPGTSANKKLQEYREYMKGWRADEEVYGKAVDASFELHKQGRGIVSRNMKKLSDAVQARTDMKANAPELNIFEIIPEFKEYLAKIDGEIPIMTSHHLTKEHFYDQLFDGISADISSAKHLKGLFNINNWYFLSKEGALTWQPEVSVGEHITKQESGWYDLQRKDRPRYNSHDF